MTPMDTHNLEFEFPTSEMIKGKITAFRVAHTRGGRLEKTDARVLIWARTKAARSPVEMLSDADYTPTEHERCLFNIPANVSVVLVEMRTAKHPITTCKFNMVTSKLPDPVVLVACAVIGKTVVEGESEVLKIISRSRKRSADDDGDDDDAPKVKRRRQTRRPKKCPQRAPPTTFWGPKDGPYEEGSDSDEPHAPEADAGTPPRTRAGRNNNNNNNVLLAANSHEGNGPLLLSNRTPVDASFFQHLVSSEVGPDMELEADLDIDRELEQHPTFFDGPPDHDAVSDSESGGASPFARRSSSVVSDSDLSAVEEDAKEEEPLNPVPVSLFCQPLDTNHVSAHVQAQDLPDPDEGGGAVQNMPQPPLPTGVEGLVPGGSILDALWAHDPAALLNDHEQSFVGVN